MPEYRSWVYHLNMSYLDNWAKLYNLIKIKICYAYNFFVNLCISDIVYQSSL